MAQPAYQISNFQEKLLLDNKKSEELHFVEDIEESYFTNFVKSHPKSHILQTAEWGKLKALGEWKTFRVGLMKNNTLCAAAMILIRQNLIPFSQKTFAYAPRGLVVDFENKEYLSIFTSYLKEFLKKHHAAFLRMDPDLFYFVRDIDGNIVPGKKNNQHIVDQLKELGYRHQGTELDFGGFQPRFTFRLNIRDSEEEIWSQFSKQTQYKIRLAQRRGIEIIEGTRDDLEIFRQLSEVTAERDSFISRPLTYFQNMYDCLAPKQYMKLFFAKYNFDKALVHVMEQIQKKQSEYQSLEQRYNQSTTQEEKKEKMYHQLKNVRKELDQLYLEEHSIQSMKQVYPDGLILSGAIALFFGDKAWYLYGASGNQFRNLMPNYLLQWYMIKEAKKYGCAIYDFFGISGDLSPDHPLYGLYLFKRGFNGDYTEFIGEFDLVVSPAYHYVLKIVFLKFNKIRRKALKLLRNNKLAKE